MLPCLADLRLQNGEQCENTMTNGNHGSNPYNLCIFESESECVGCSLQGKLGCHFSSKELLRFIGVFSFILITGSAALIFYGLTNYFLISLGAFVAFAVLFFEFWEIRILCSHCPFYAEGTRTIHCTANYGSLKIWKYRPGPMSRSEEIQLAIGFVILAALVVLPSTFLITNGHYLWAVPPIVGLAAFGYILRRFHCDSCINFACPFNPMPRSIRDEFLKRNPILLRAWETK